MPKTLPYINAYGNVGMCLNKTIEAQTSQTFSQDFLGSIFEMTGGGATPLIKFLKNVGFLSHSGVPTDIYRSFRTESARGGAAAEALRIGYADLFKQNEYIYKVFETKFKETIISALQCDTTDKLINKIAKCFTTINSLANFEQSSDNTLEPTETQPLQQFPNLNQGEHSGETIKAQSVGLNLAYTVNLNLPESTNPEVFDAIFKSLKENLLNND